MDAIRNKVLETWMTEHGYSSNALADAVNLAIGRLTGRSGGLDGASVRAWKAGRVTWPKSATRRALEDVTALPAVALGFVPRGQHSPSPASPRQHESEPGVKRRSLVGGIAAVAVATAASGTPSPQRIGMSDVNRLNRRFTEIVTSDHRNGSRLATEHRAAALADEALALQKVGSATQRVRNSLYASAAAFRSSAMWAAIDGRRFDVAKAHMREAQALAEMSGDQAIKFRIWSHAGTLYRHMGRATDALAANDVARNLNLARRDSLFACLGHARQASTLGLIGDSAAVRHALGCAQDALERADLNLARPIWMAGVLSGAELETLSLSAYLRLGAFGQAESHGHRSLTLLPVFAGRDRAINFARLAHAQLGQGAADAATASAMQIPVEVALRHPRVSRMLQKFDAALRSTAPRSTSAQSWAEHTAAWSVEAFPLRPRSNCASSPHSAPSVATTAIR
ncbi:XRE family transcriptional regulator [Streptomyces sp. NPDC001493]